MVRPEGLHERPKTSEEKLKLVIERAAELQEEMAEHYCDIHENPELGGQEIRTSKKVLEYLDSLNIEILGKEIGWKNNEQEEKLTVQGEKFTPVDKMESVGTGIVAIIRGKSEGPTIALRADMDALPIQEDSNNPHHSKKDGLMHACGHDAHTSALMGAAKILKEMADKGELDGNVMLLFQPSEEKATQKKSGSVRMVKFLEDNDLRKDIKAFLGLHVYTERERGEINVGEGVQIASSGELDITLKSSGGHVINAYEIPNLNQVFSEINVRLHDTFKRLYENNEALVASTRTDFPAGGYNILPSSGKSTWVVRIGKELYKEMSKDVRAQIEWVVNDVVKKYQKDGEDTIEVKIDNRHGYRPVVHRDKDLVDIARKTSGQVIEDVKLTDEKLLGGEDFSFYLEELRGKQIPGIFMMIGAANKEKGINKSPHHNPKFQIDPDMLQDMAAIHAGFVINYLEKLKK